MNRYESNSFERADELAVRLIDEGLSLPEESLGRHERRRMAEHQWLHAMLEHVHERGSDAKLETAESRVRRLIAAVRAGQRPSQETSLHRPNEVRKPRPEERLAGRAYYVDVRNAPYEGTDDTVRCHTGDTIGY